MEKLERTTFLEFFACMPPAYSAKHGAKFSDHETLAFLAMRGLPGFEFNRVLGLGIEEPASEAQLTAAIDWMRSNCNPLSSLQIAPDASPTDLQHWIADRGLKPGRTGWAVFRRGPFPVADHPVATSLTVREVHEADAALFGKITQTGFALPPDFAAFPAAMVGRAAIRAYLAYDDMQPVASALLCIKDAWGWLGFNATLPAFRRRGAQNALLSRRLADGIAMGLRGFVIETDNPAPGDIPHPSYRNIRRAGFELAYVRTNYRLAGS